MTRENLFKHNDIPLKIDILKGEGSRFELSEYLKIVVVLYGNVEISSGNNCFNLSQGEICIINMYYDFCITGKSTEQWEILELSLDSMYLNRIYAGFLNMEFLFSSKLTSLENSEKLKKYIYEILKAVKEKNENSFMILEGTMKLCNYIIKNFKVKNNKQNNDFVKIKYIKKIMELIENNYCMESFNTENIAKELELTPQYTLKLFRSFFGMGLIDYLNIFRIKKSINALLHSNKSIVEIAIDNGFTSNKTYHRVFKKVYKETPGNYKKNRQKDNQNNKRQNVSEFLKLFNTDSNKSVSNDSKEMIYTDIDILKKKNLKKLNKYWSKVLCLGKAFEGLKGEIQEQIREIVKEIKFEYIKINCIFNDELFIYNEDESGDVYYNYAYIDKLLDFFVSVNLKPFINIGFTPKHLKSDEKYVLSSNVSYPKDMDKWNDLIKNLFIHFEERYGSQVFDWKFEIWNNPSGQKMYWHDTEEKFFDFYKTTFTVIKSVSDKFSLGTTPMMAYMKSDYLENLFKYLKKNKIKPDFFSFNNFTVKNIKFTSINSTEWNYEFYEYDEMKNIIKNVVKKVRENFSAELPVVVSEWNSNAYYLDLIHDTCYMGTFIIDTVLNNFNTVEALSYWTAFETRAGKGMFFGGLGLFTINNLKKTSYNAFVLLNKLGDKIVERGNNYIITSNDKGYQILLYNYVHYSKEYREGNLRNITLTDRYKAFEENSSKEMIFNLKNLKSGKYKIKKYYLNRNSGSVFDSWVEMGAPQNIDNEDFEYLKSKQYMKMKVESINIQNEYIIKETLNAHEVVLYILN